MLNQEDPSLLARQLRYNHYFLQARTRNLQKYQSTLVDVGLSETALQKALEDLREQYQALAQQQKLLLMQRADRARALQNLRNRLKNKGDTLKQLTKDKSALAKVIAATRAAMSRLPAPKDYQAFGQLKGKLPWPLSGALKGKSQNRFGAARSGSLKWDGLLFSAPLGTPVTAIHAGRVVFADWLSGFGLLLIVDHGGGYLSLYAHNEVLLKQVGEWIRSGDTISRSGDSGVEENPGLYFEIRYQGVPVDPARWCR